MKILTSLFLLLLLAPASHAQNETDAAGLKGVRRIYVDTGGDLKNRERIIRELKKSGSGFEFLPTLEGAELVLFFASEKVKTPTGVETQPPISGIYPDKPEVIYEDIELGTGMAYVPKQSGGGQVIFRWEGQRKFMARSATKFAAAFVNEYGKANRRG